MAAVSLLGSAGLLVWIGIQLWAAVHGGRVAYRVLYHAEQPPDGKAIGLILQALARNVGQVTLVWCVGPRASQDTLANPGAAQITIPESGTELGTEHAPLEPNPLLGDDKGCSPMNVSLHIVAPASARSALEGVIPGLLPGVWAEHCKEPQPIKSEVPGWAARVWRWDATSASSGHLADPFACGLHLSELEQRIAASAGPYRAVSEIEVRLTIWARGHSAVVTACHGLAERPSDTAAPLSVEEQEGHFASLQDIQLSFLKALLWSWPFRRRVAMRDRRVTGEGPACRNQTKVLPDQRNRLRTTAGAGLLGVLAAKLASRYPLWERTGTRTSHKSSHKSTHQSSHQQSQDNDAQRATIGPSDLDTDNDGNGSICLHFPPTISLYSSLDSISAGEISLPPAYSLPPFPAQVLVLGSATQDGGPVGVPVGVPALRRSSGALAPISGPADFNTGSAHANHEYNRSRLHSMLAEHLLVAGGTDPWRRDVAGSVVSQALEMGMTVVAVDGGSPPDEPPAAAAKRARLISAELRRSISGSSSSVHRPTTTGNADPLSPIMLRLGDSIADRGVAQIDLDNPAGSVRPNMLFVQAPRSLPPVQGESLALSLALGPGLSAQMNYLQAVNVTGMDAGITNSGLTNPSADGTDGTDGASEVTPGEAIVEAWLTVLLLRHHRARLLLAVRGMEHVAQTARIERLQDRQNGQPLVSPFSAAHRLPSCPDLPTLMLVLEEPETLMGLLRREREAWGDPDWLSVIRDMGGLEGESAAKSAQQALERVSSIESLDLSDQYLYGATLRGQLQRLLGHPAIGRMLRGPHISLADLLDNGMTRLLKVNLSGAYETVALPYSDDDMARKQYGLYLLWSIWAASRQRATLSERVSQRQPDGPALWRAPRPLLLMLHGAGSWFGSGSPLSELCRYLLSWEARPQVSLWRPPSAVCVI